MNQKNLIIVVVVLGIVIFVIGGGLGMMFQVQKSAPQIALQTSKLAVSEAVVKSLSSKVVPSMIAYGQVTNIEGNNVTLSYANETLVVNIAQNANIIVLTPVSGSTTPVQKRGVFSEIKKGDNLNITLKLFADGKIEGQSVIILMPTTK